MATAKRQPSGMYKVRVYSHSDENGKHYRSFTASTKAEAEQLAARFSGTADRASRMDLTVSEAVSGYIRAKENVLSPSTIRSYKIMERNHFDDIGSVRIRKLTTERVQLWVSNLAKDNAPKTVKNVYALLTASVRLYAPETIWRITLPTIKKEPRTAPSDDVVMVLYKNARGWMKIAVALAAFGSLRAGEACALRYGDIEDGVIHVERDMVRTSQGGWVIKDMPKTTDSVRCTDTIPQEIFDMIGTGEPDELVLHGHAPSRISDNFRNLCKRLGITGVRFHDLRHYYASTGAGIMPDVYLSKRGGWGNSSPVMKTVYQHVKDKESEKYAGKMRRKFDKMLKNV